MNLTKLNYLNLIIRKMLKKSRINIVLDDIEKLKEYNQVKIQIQKYLLLTVKNFLSLEQIEKLFTMTRKSDVNPQIQYYIEKEIVKTLPSERFIEILVRFLGLSEVIAGQDAVDTIGVNIKYTLRNTEFIRRNVNNLIPTINQTTAKELSKKLEEAREGFLTIEETFDFLNEYMEMRAEQRAEIITQNESSLVANATQNDVYQKSGVVELRWVTSRDERVCPICRPLDGKVVNINAGFGNVRYPPAHINCRCFVEPVERKEIPVWTGR